MGRPTGFAKLRQHAATTRRYLLGLYDGKYRSPTRIAAPRSISPGTRMVRDPFSARVVVNGRSSVAGAGPSKRIEW